MAIKVKPVRWRGWDFLSSTEARWAQLFKAVDVSFAYEPGTANCDDGDLFYKSDFWVPAYESFVEIKGASPVTPDALKKAATLCAETRKDVRIFVGDPLECSIHSFHFVSEEFYRCLKTAFDPLIAQNPARVVDIARDGFIEHLYSDAPIWCPSDGTGDNLIPKVSDDESFAMFDGRTIEFSAFPPRMFWSMAVHDHAVRGWRLPMMVFFRATDNPSQADIDAARAEKAREVRELAETIAEKTLTESHPRLQRAMRTARMMRFH